MFSSVSVLYFVKIIDIFVNSILLLFVGLSTFFMDNIVVHVILMINGPADYILLS